MSFTLDISRACEAMKGNTDKAVRKVLLDLGTSLVMKSPVGDRELWLSLGAAYAIGGKHKKIKGAKGPAGYVGGRFRANWQYGFSAAPNGELYKADDKSFPKSGEVLAKIKEGVTTSPAAGIHYIANNLPYAQRLEDGWSTQAPAGILELTIIEFPGIVKRSQA